MIHRTKTGDWIFTFRSYAEESIRGEYSVQMGISSEDDVATASHGPAWNYVCDLMAHSATEEEAMAAGSFMILKDSQVKKMQTANSLFVCTVEIIKKAH